MDIKIVKYAKKQSSKLHNTLKNSSDIQNVYMPTSRHTVQKHKHV